MTTVIAHWTVLDYVIIGIIFVSLLLGLFRGFAKEIISLAAWVLGFFAALKLSPTVDQWLVPYLPHAMARYVLSMVGIFFVVVLIGCIVNKIIHAFLKFTGFGFLDHMLGLVFGLLRGLLFVVLILLLIRVTPFQQEAVFAQSELSPYFQPIVERFSANIPNDLKVVHSAATILNRLIAVNHDSVSA
jgi:membrane protein required for colicin V production